MEVDAEPRADEIRNALSIMTTQRTFPYVFVHGRFYANSYAVQKGMKNGSFFELIDDERDKQNWLIEKEDYAEKIKKRKKDKEASRRKKLDRIKKKIADSGMGDLKI